MSKILHGNTPYDASYTVSAYRILTLRRLLSTMHKLKTQSHLVEDFSAVPL